MKKIRTDLCIGTSTGIYFIFQVKWKHDVDGDFGIK